MEPRPRALALTLATLAACGDVDNHVLTDMSLTTSDSSSTTPGTTTATGGLTTTAPTTTGADPGTTTGAPATTGTSSTAASTTDPGTTTSPAACVGGGLGSGDHIVMLEHGDKTREAIVHVPPGYDPDVPTPLVLNFHGFTAQADDQVQFSQMNPVADAHGFIVVYPQGRYNSWNAGLCCGQAVAENIDDIGFIRALVVELHTMLCLDPRRIYAAGMSNGGYISHRLACEAADLVAAVGPVSATVVIDPCLPSRPIPVMMYNGTADLIVPYGGGLYQSAPQSFMDWAARNGCTDEPEITAQVGAVTCETVDECDDDVAVTLCTVEGMGHCWPGNPNCLFGVPNTDVSASEALWTFFRDYTLP